MGKSAPGYALRGFPHSVLYHLLTLQGRNGGTHTPHCATLHASRHHDGRLKSLGKIQRAPLGTFKRAPTHDYIVEKIRSREWAPGDKIPSETELGRLLETSRLSAREALNKLIALGLLIRKHGSGSFVAEMNVGSVIDFVIPLILMEKEDLLSVLEYRLYFETGNIELFMRNPSLETIKELEEHYEKMIQNPYESETFSLEDFYFHRTIARATGNAFIARISELLTNVLINHQAHLNKSIGSNVGLDYHKRILDAIKAGDKELAVLMMRRHIEATIDAVRSTSTSDDHDEGKNSP